MLNTNGVSPRKGADWPKLDLDRIQRALTHALGASLGKLFKPMTSGGVEAPADVEAVAALMELREYLATNKGGSRE